MNGVNEAVVAYWQDTVATVKEAPLVFAALWGGEILALYFGIVASRKARPLPRSHYFIAIVGINVIVLLVRLFASAIDQGFLAFGLDIGAWLVIAILVGGAYFLSFYTARRLDDIGWSRYFTWLLLPAWVAYLTVILLVFIPSKPQRQLVGGGVKTGMSMR
jgi:uncharacterized membrane protein YhaH (DUF805 family)